MTLADAPVGGGFAAVPVRPLDAESAEWVRSLAGAPAEREAAAARLHEVLLRIARSEVRRRGDLRVTGAELDDLAHQAAADALMAITSKVGQFRGESRFTTWAYKFVIFDVSIKIGRHFWRHPRVALGAEDWDRLADRFGLGPPLEPECRELLDALHRAVDEDLTDHLRQVFVAIFVHGVPLDAPAAKVGSSRNALYETVFDARRKLRSALVANGHLDNGSSR